MALNFNLLNTELPGQIATSAMRGYESAQNRSIELAQQKQQNQLNALKISEAQRTEQSQNALSRAYSESVDPVTGAIDYNKLTRLVAASGGGGGEIPGIQKARSEQLTAQLAQQKAKTELVNARLEQVRRFLDTIDPTDPNAPALYMKWHEANHLDPVLGPELAIRGVTAEQSNVQIQQAIAQGPQAFADLINKSKLGIEKFIEINKKELVNINMDDRVVSLTFKPLTGELKTVGTQIKTANLPPRVDPPPRKKLITSANGEILLVNLNTGTATQVKQNGQPIRSELSATEQKREQLFKDISQTILELREISKEGGLIDQSTGSGAGQAINHVARFFGHALPGDIARGKLAPIADMVLKMVPRFEGPQSDKDTQSYKEAAGQLADSSLPQAIRKAAAKEIIRIMMQRKEQFVTGDMVNQGAPSAPPPPPGFIKDS